MLEAARPIKSKCGRDALVMYYPIIGVALMSGSPKLKVFLIE